MLALLPTIPLFPGPFKPRGLTVIIYKHQSEMKLSTLILLLHSTEAVKQSRLSMIQEISKHQVLAEDYRVDDATINEITSALDGILTDDFVESNIVSPIKANEISDDEQEEEDVVTLADKFPDLFTVKGRTSYRSRKEKTDQKQMTWLEKLK